VIEWLERNQIRPYCTNLIPACGANIKRAPSSDRLRSNSRSLDARSR
jgi:hypothetical protein